MNDKLLHNLKKTIASTNVNFLIGSGLSRPFLDVLQNIETQLTQAENDGDEAKILVLKEEYFTKCMKGNLEVVDESENTTKNKVLQNYKDFYKSINYLLLKREDSILTKQVNVFTTNVDVFSEKALEETGIEFNDGFSGRFSPRYNIGNFKKSYFKKSLHYENTSEVPIFNILKLHGSLSWKKDTDGVVLDQDLQLLREVESDVASNYDRLMIVNPTKKKFEDTVLNQYYYDLLRVYSNELEKENSVLFVMGFSFADEHIRDLTMQVMGSNPTLMVYIISHGSSPNPTYDEMKEKARNKNIEVLYPPDGEKYNLKTVTEKVFEKIYSDEEGIVPESDEASNVSFL